MGVVLFQSQTQDNGERQAEVTEPGAKHITEKTLWEMLGLTLSLQTELGWTDA